MKEIALWHALAEPPRRNEAPDEAVLAGLQRLALLPLRCRAIFAARAAAWWRLGSPVVQIAVLGVLHGSRTPAALRLAILALDDADANVREAGFSLLAEAAKEAPYRWTHALFHPRSEVRKAAIEQCPHPTSRRPLPWLREDPEHGNHPVVRAARLPARLALELCERGCATHAELTCALQMAAPAELTALLQTSPLRGPPSHEGTGKAQHRGIEAWCAAWQAADPEVRRSMERVLQGCLSGPERIPEPSRRNLADALRGHVDAHPDALTLASIAVTLTPGWLEPEQWALPIQRGAALHLHLFPRLGFRAGARGSDPLRPSSLTCNDRGDLEVTICVNLARSIGGTPLARLDRLFGSPEALDQAIAKTPECWPAVAVLLPKAPELVPRLRAVFPPAVQRIVALGVFDWEDADGKALVEQLKVEDALPVLEALPMPEPGIPLGAASKALAAFLGHPSRLAVAVRTLLERSTPPAELLALVLANGSAKGMGALVAGLGREPVRTLVSTMRREPGSFAAVSVEHFRALLTRIEAMPEAYRGRDAFWNAEEYAPIAAWIAGHTGRKRSVVSPPHGPLTPAEFLSGNDRNLADVLLAIDALPTLEAKVEALRASVDAAIEGLRHSRGTTLGVPAANLPNWATGCAQNLKSVGVTMLVRWLDRPPPLAEPAARLLVALRNSDAMSEALTRSADTVLAMAPDTCLEARQHLGDWPRPDATPCRDPDARPWDEDAPTSASPQADLVRDAAQPTALRFRAALQLASADPEAWLPVLFELATAPLPAERGRAKSWFGPRDWDDLVAIARSREAPPKKPSWWQRLGRAWRGETALADDPGMRRVAIALAASDHPHAHRRAVEWLLCVPRTPEIEEALVRAAWACWSFPPALRARLAAAVAEQALECSLCIELDALVEPTWDPKQGLPNEQRVLAAQTVLDAAIWTGVVPLTRCQEVLEAIDEREHDLDAQWRGLVEVAPNGPVRTAALARIVRPRSLDPVVDRIARTFAWGIRTGRELTGAYFAIHLTQRREDLGFIRAGEGVIHVSPAPILTNHPEGRDIVEGLILHEFGHHLYHHDEKALSIWKKAQRLGLFPLLNLVADEHLERNLRALQPEYGDRLKRLVTYAFSYLGRDLPVETALAVFGARAFAALHVRPLDVAESEDEIRIRSGQVLTELDRVGDPLARFMRALRMGLGNRHDDPILEQALALFEGDFRDKDMVGLLEIASKLARLYGTRPRRTIGGGVGDLLDIFGGHETLPDACDLSERAGLRNEDVQREIKRILAPPGTSSESTPPPPNPKTLVINVGKSIDFRRIERVEAVARDPAAHRALAGDVRRYAERLRRDLIQLGLAQQQERARLSGRAFDRTRTRAVVLKGDPRMLVARKHVVQSDLFMGVAIDCSGSMAGTNLDKARRFGVLLAEAARGLRDVDARFIGFTDRVIFDAGDQKRCAVSQLRSTGGNNDAAALAHIATLARASRRRSKLLIMVSDGLPTECSVVALRGLIEELTRRHAMLCAQIAVTRITEPCFRHYVEVLDGDFHASARKFGRIVTGLARGALAR